MSTSEFSEFEALDLAPIKMKLMHVESGEGWSAIRADAVETEYRRFLFLMKKYPDAQTSPTVDVDTFWHYHILDTMKYASDCEAAFGYFLHHYPYVGMGAESQDSDRIDAGERMRVIYEAEFGDATRSEAAWCGSPNKQAEGAAWCGSPGKKGDVSAWCGSPNKKAEMSAWCGSPGSKAETAWCGSPGVKAETAWCGSPGKKLSISAAVATAWCGSPGKAEGESANAATAWCGSPGIKADTAWCGSPGKKLGLGAPLATAWCGSPGKSAGVSANAATAWCGSPGKELAQAA
jgi:hypothetical protein